MAKIGDYQKAGWAASSVLRANVVGAIVGLANTAALAYFFGAGRGIQVYFAAATLYTLVLKFSQAGLWGEVLVPYVVENRMKSETASAWATISNIVNLMGLFGIGLVILFAGITTFAIRLFVPGFSATDQQRVVQLFLLLTPVVVMTMTSTVLVAVLNAYKQFGQPELVKALAHLVGLISLVILASRFGVIAVVVSSWLYSLLHLLGVGLLLRRLGYRHLWRLDRREPVFRQVLKAMLPYVPYTIITQLVQYAMLAILSALPEGAYGVYWYVQTLYEQINVTLLRPIPRVSFTWFSEAAATRDLLRLRQRLAGALQMLAFIAAPVTLGIILLASPIVQLLWQRGQFSSQETGLAATVLSIASLTFFFDGSFLLLRQFLVACKRMVLINIIRITMQIIFVTLFYILTMQFGAPGAVTARLLIGIIGTLSFWICLRIYYPTVANCFDPAFALKLLLLVVMTGLAVWFVNETLLRLGWGDKTVSLFGLAGLSASILLLLYGGGAVLLKMREATELRHLIVKRLSFNG